MEFTEQAEAVLQRAMLEAEKQDHPEVTAAHIVDAFLSESEIVPRIIEKAGGSTSRIQDATERKLNDLPKQRGADQAQWSRVFQSIRAKAEKFVEDRDDQYVSVEHLLLALLDVTGHNAEDILSNLTIQEVQSAVDDSRGASGPVTDPNPEGEYDVLEQFGRDLTQEARDEELDPVIGREEEIRRLMRILSRRTKNNPVLIGEPGVGKTAIVEGVARRIVEGDVPESLNDKQLIELNVGSMIAGSKYRGEFEDRMESFIDEVTASDDIILFIDELHTVVGAGAAEGSVDASNMLKPPLARGDLRAIGATTLDEFREHIEDDKALERRFQQILVEENTVEETISVLRGLQERYEAHHGVNIQDEALVQAAKLSDRYIGERFLPDKAIDLIDEASASLRMQMDSKPTAIDRLEREERQLEMEAQSLEDDDSEGAQERLQEIQQRKKELNSELQGLEEQWQEEKELLDQLSELHRSIDEAQRRAAQAEREGNLDQASKIRHGEIPDLEEELDEIGEKLDSLDEEQRMLKEDVTASDVAEIVANWTGIPVQRLLESEREKLQTIEDRLRERVIAQDHAVTAVSDAIRRARTGLQPSDRPIGSFIFMGPTGVGKTELAKALAEFMFDDEDNMVRVDMSEFMEKHSVSRFMGAPPGYVGYEEGGYLTEQVRRKPYSVVLFDEIEKAHRDVMNAMLQILDDGRMTDGQGRTVDFRNTVLIMTSNVGSDIIQEAFNEKPDLEPGEQRYDRMVRDVEDALSSHFRPEFLNRIDETLVFNSLTQDDIKRIVDIQMRQLLDELDEIDFSIELSGAAKDKLAERGYDPAYGARPLSRTIQSSILNPLAETLVNEGEAFDGQDVVQVDVGPDGDFTFE